MNEKHWIERTDKDINFTASGIQDQILLETLNSLPNNVQKPNIVNITRITLWSDQNLDWDITFFKNNVSQPNSDLDLNTMVDWITFLVADGVQIAGTGPFIYSVSGLSLAYFPDDRQFHVGLINRNVTTKLAGSNGEVVIEIQGTYQ